MNDKTIKGMMPDMPPIMEKYGMRVVATYAKQEDGPYEERQFSTPAAAMAEGYRYVQWLWRGEGGA